jgi:hypothetical protein
MLSLVAAASDSLFYFSSKCIFECVCSPPPLLATSQKFRQALASPTLEQECCTQNTYRHTWSSCHMFHKTSDLEPEGAHSVAQRRDHQWEGEHPVVQWLPYLLEKVCQALSVQVHWLRTMQEGQLQLWAHPQKAGHYLWHCCCRSEQVVTLAERSNRSPCLQHRAVLFQARASS